MDLEYGPQYEQFRADVRAFLERLLQLLNVLHQPESSLRVWMLEGVSSRSSNKRYLRIPADSQFKEGF